MLRSLGHCHLLCTGARVWAAPSIRSNELHRRKGKVQEWVGQEAEDTEERDKDRNGTDIR